MSSREIQLELIPSEGRDFIDVQRQAEKERKPENTPAGARREAMKVGDYIDMFAEEFLAWSGPVVGGDLKRLERKGKVRVALVEIKPDDQIVVRADVGGDGVQKQVHASLFYNYGYSFVS